MTSKQKKFTFCFFRWNILFRINVLLGRQCKEDIDNFFYYHLIAIHLSSDGSAALWARIAQNVKKPPLKVNVIDFEFFGFNVPIWVPWSPLGPKVMIHW